MTSFSKTRWPPEPFFNFFSSFFKRLQTSFVHEHKFTKLTQMVYVNKGMSFIIFGLILKNKMVVLLLEPLPSPAFTILTKVSLSCLLFFLEICNAQSTLRKSYAANLLVVSDLTLDCSFKVKLWWLSIKVPISCLLLVLEVCNVESTFRKPLAGNLTWTLLLSLLLCAVDTFVHLATDANIV